MGRRVIELYDALLTGNDMEVTPRLTLARRPGYVAYAPAVMNGTLLNTYTWKTASNGVYQIFDTTVDIEYIAPGVTSPTVFYTKPAGTIGNKTYFFGVGNYLFFSGIGFSGKWDGPTGTQGVTQWGVSNTSTAAVLGPNTPSTATAFGGPPSWTNPNDLLGNTAFSTIGVTSTNLSSAGKLKGTGFSFSVPATSTIAGISVTFNGKAINPGPSELGIVTLKNGNLIGTGHTVSLTGNSVPYTAGGPNDLWGATWTANDINSSTFGILFFPAGASSAFTTTYEVNDLQVTIYTNNGPTISVIGSGSFTAVNGYTYVVAYGNSVSTEISNASPPSANTGPFTNAQAVQITLVASPDPQVNQIHVYRTTDSGGGSIYLELPTSPYPNANANVDDASVDINLQVNNIAAANLQNTPPPANLVAMEWFAARLWGAVGNLLYFSTGPDSLSGLQQSNWNPAYVAVVPTTIIRLESTPNGMLVHTVDDCLIVRGTSTVSFTVNEFMRDLAVRNYNAVDSDGSNFYIFTTDRQFLCLNPSGMNNIGQEIGDQLLAVDPTQCYVTAYRYGLDSMVFLVDTVNGVIYPWNVNQQCWCLPAILKFTVTACGAIEISPGVWKFIVGTGGENPSLGQRDLNTFTDLGTAYSPQVVVGSIQVADPGTLAKEDLVFLELTNAGNAPTNVAVLPNDGGATLTNAVGNQITGKFITLVTATGINPEIDPPTYGAQPVNYRSYRYNWLQSAAPAAIKHVQILIQFGNENAQNEILGLGLGGKQSGDSPAAGQIPQLMGH
jgi:hypothetical protein